MFSPNILTSYGRIHKFFYVKDSISLLGMFTVHGLGGLSSAASRDFFAARKISSGIDRKAKDSAYY